MAGSCMMAGQTCPVAAPAGQMTCWDGSTVANYTSCPAMPTDSAGCVAKGANWCVSSATSYGGSTGYCMGKSSTCPKYPPAGQMTCPDNVTFATTLTECPTVGSTTLSPTLKTCPDGSIVDKTWVCPVVYLTCSDGKTKVKSLSECPITFKTCPDGSKVESTVTCPVKTEDQVTACLGKNGKWCLDKAGGTGYCVTKGDCNILSDDNGDKTTEQLLALDPKQIKLAEAKKKEYLRSLDTLEKTIKRFDDKESLAKIAALREKLASMPVDSNVFDALEAMKDDILTLREVKDNLIASQG